MNLADYNKMPTLLPTSRMKEITMPTPSIPRVPGAEAGHYTQWVERQRQHPYVLKEAALLFETGSNQLLDKVIVVEANETLRMQRVLQRDRHRTAPCACLCCRQAFD